MLRDISTRSDLEIIVKKFYTDLLNDDLVSEFFTTVVSLDLEEHLPVIVDFWASVLLHDMSYKGNVMLKHIEIHKIKKLERAHFKKWVAMWEMNIDKLHSGKLAEDAKKRARMMMELMLVKVSQSEDQNFIQ